jgi:hypothetical protein
MSLDILYTKHWMDFIDDFGIWVVPGWILDLDVLKNCPYLLLSALSRYKNAISRSQAFFWAFLGLFVLAASRCSSHWSVVSHPLLVYVTRSSSSLWRKVNRVRMASEMTLILHNWGKAPQSHLLYSFSPWIHNQILLQFCFAVLCCIVFTTVHMLSSKWINRCLLSWRAELSWPCYGALPTLT